MQTLGHQHHQTEQSKETGRGAFYRPHAPVALRFQSQMRAYLLEAHFDVPASHIPTDYLLREEGGILDVAAEEGSGLDSNLARAFVLLFIADQNPSDRDRVL